MLGVCGCACVCVRSRRMVQRARQSVSVEPVSVGVLLLIEMSLMSNTRISFFPTLRAPGVPRH